MAADYNRESGGLGLEIQPSEIVKNVDRSAGQFQHFGLGKLSSPVTLVDIATHSDRGSNRRKLIENL